jgi:hypothetical protein
MAARFQRLREEGNIGNPLILEDFQLDNEWVDNKKEIVREGDDLAWAHVHDAIGASSSLQGRNFPRGVQYESVYSRSCKQLLHKRRELWKSKATRAMNKMMKSTYLTMMMKWMTLVNPHITVQLKLVLVVKKMQWMILIWEIFRVSSIYLAAAAAYLSNGAYFLSSLKYIFLLFDFQFEIYVYIWLL